MLRINDLPEDVLVEVLSCVPGRDLVIRCRPVCCLWRDVVDLPTLWKRKCQLDGFLPKGGIRNPEDWRCLYFLLKLKKNLLRNPCAEDRFNHWNIDRNGGNRWAIEDLPGEHGQSVPDPEVNKYFVTSYGYSKDLSGAGLPFHSDCTKSQLVDLKAAGYWDELMDEVQPDIVVSDCYSKDLSGAGLPFHRYAAREDCGCRYDLTVKLLSKNKKVLKKFKMEPVIIQQWSDAKWRQMTHVFQKYGPGVRYVRFQHGGMDTQFWAGWYGIRVTNSSLVIAPPGHRDSSNESLAVHQLSNNM